MEKEAIGILFSGGLESTSLVVKYWYYNYNIRLIYIENGFRWEKTEKIYAKKIAEYFNLEITFLNFKHNISLYKKITSYKENIIKMRNLFLITNAANFLVHNNINRLAVGLLGDNRYPDTSIEYITEIEKLISLGINKKFNIEIPFYGLKKEEVFNKYYKCLPLNLIFSCTSPINNQRCHSCYKCIQLDNLLKSIK